MHWLMVMLADLTYDTLTCVQLGHERAGETVDTGPFVLAGPVADLKSISRGKCIKYIYIGCQNCTSNI